MWLLALPSGLLTVQMTIWWLKGEVLNDKLAILKWIVDGNGEALQ